LNSPEQIMKNTAHCVVLAALSPAVALAQIGNPAGMAPDTRFDRPGVPAPHQTNYQDRLFAQLASSGGQAEVEFGKLAESKADSAKVKDFARRMIHDHTEANKRLTDLADASKIPLPRDLDPDHQQIRSTLEKLDGSGFDLAYMRAQIVEHQKTAQLLEWEIAFGEDADIQRFASATLPTVLDHLQAARDIQAEIAHLTMAR